MREGESSAETIIMGRMKQNKTKGRDIIQLGAVGFRGRRSIPTTTNEITRAIAYDDRFQLKESRDRLINPRRHGGVQ